MQYSKKVLQHFKNPHNQGVIKDADAVGEAGNLKCGDIMKIYLKINRRQTADSRTQAEGPLGKEPALSLPKEGWGDYFIKDVKFETLGCAAAIAVSSALTDMVKGMTLDEAMKLTKDKIVEELDGLPPIKMHCSMLALEALRKAINEYKNKSL